MSTKNAEFYTDLKSQQIKKKCINVPNLQKKVAIFLNYILLVYFFLI